MAHVQCPECHQASGAIYKKKDLAKTFVTNAPMAGLIAPAVLTAIIALITTLLKEGMALFRDREQLYGVCHSCGHLWKID